MLAEAATLVGGVTLIIMPTLSLASDQLAKFTKGKYKNLCTIHLDEVVQPLPGLNSGFLVIIG
jgi:hypothetical protein